MAEEFPQKEYIVAYLDILGQKELLKKHRHLTETIDGQNLLATETGQRSFQEIQGKTYGKVVGLRENFEFALGTFRKSFLTKPDNSNLSEEDKRAIKDAVELPISIILPKNWAHD